MGTVYVADRANARIMRWPEGSTAGTVMVGGYGTGTAMIQFYGVYGLSFDAQGNFYIMDCGNDRVQKYELLSL